MTVFVDTSAFYAVLDRDDVNHVRAGEVWQLLLREQADFVTNNYVLLETMALTQHRLGTAAVRSFHEDVVPVLTIDWITESRHRTAAGTLLTASRKKLSLVDCVSFQTMRELSIRAAFCFDHHFRQQGFEIIPHISM